MWKKTKTERCVSKSAAGCVWLMVVVCLAGATVAWGQKKANSTKNLTMEEMTAQAEGGDADAQYKVGMRYYGEGGPRHPEKYVEALKWFQLSAGQGDGEAEDRIGVMYYFGQGVTKDYAEAAHWYQLAGEKGISHAQWQLSDMYSRGLGVPRDMAESKRWAKLGKRPDKGAARIQIVFAGAVLVAVAFALGLFALQFRTLTGWKYIGVAIFVHVGGAFLIINTLITYGFFIVFPHCSFNFLAPSCTQISDPHTRGFVNSIGSYAMANIIFRFMMIVGLAMDVLAVWYVVYLVRLVMRRGKRTQAVTGVARATS